MKTDEYGSEIIDAGRTINITTKSKFDRNNPAKKLKRERTIGYDQTNSLGSQGDFDKDFDSIFLD